MKKRLEEDEEKRGLEKEDPKFQPIRTARELEMVETGNRTRACFVIFLLSYEVFFLEEVALLLEFGFLNTLY